MIDDAAVGYWNHNTAFHDELVAEAALVGGRMIDVGCGDGLLAWRLAAVASEVVALDPDPAAIERAHRRLDGLPHAQVVVGDVFTTLNDEVFDVVTCVAALHHLPLRSGLARLRSLVAPGGLLLVVGLCANRSVADLFFAALQVVPVRALGWLRNEVRDVGVPTTPPRESLYEIREAARRRLPGAVVRRRLYYRYTLVWRRPDD